MPIAFVTGANKGIGFGIVKKLAEYYANHENWNIYLTSRNEELGLKAVSSLNDIGLKVKFHQLDITDSNSRHKFLNYIKSNYSNGIDIAVNNAGIAYKNDSTVPFGEQARVTIHTNFTCTVDFLEEILPLMSQNSRIVNVSSQVSLVALGKLSNDLYEKFISPLSMSDLRALISEFVKLAETNEHCKNGWPNTAYGVSKLGLSKASFILGDKLMNDPRNVYINACCPGYVDTDMTSHKGTKTIEQGADTPCYLATLSCTSSDPRNKFVAERKVIDFLRTAH